MRGGRPALKEGFDNQAKQDKDPDLCQLFLSGRGEREFSDTLSSRDVIYLGVVQKQRDSRPNRAALLMAVLGSKPPRRGPTITGRMATTLN